MGDQGGTHALQVVGMDIRQSRTVFAVAIFQADAEHHLHARVMYTVVLQIPIPQAEVTGLQRQGQPRLALAEFGGALGDALFEAVVGAAQLLFGMPALLDLGGQAAIEQVGFAAGLLQPLDQPLPVQALFDAVGNQPADLPGDQTERRQHDHRQHAPALLQRLAAGHQQQSRRQQTGHGETEKGRQADAIGDTGGQHHGAHQAVEQGLGDKGIGRHQRHHGVGQAQRRGTAAQQEAPAPVRRRLRLGAGSIEGSDLLQAQQPERGHPAQPDAEFDTALFGPEHHPADQRGEQQQQGGSARTAIQQPRVLGSLLDRRSLVSDMLR